MPIHWAYLLMTVGILSILFYLFYPQVENFFLFYPQTRFDMHPSDWRLHYEDVAFTAEDRIRLHGWFFPLEGDRPVLLFCHGNAGNISHRIENVALLLEQNLQVFIFDYRGYGKSAGSPSEKGIYRDGLAACDFLVKQKFIAPERILVFGRSLGAAVAVEIALHRKVGALILESAFTSSREMAKTMFLFRPFAFLLPLHYNNLEKIPRISVPKLIIHGEKDEIVPFSMGQKLYQSSRAPKKFLPVKAASHNDTYVVGGRSYFEALASFAGGILGHPATGSSAMAMPSGTSF